MTAIRKRRRPANDPHPQASQRMSCVALPRPYWNAHRISVAAVLAVFVFIFGLVLVAGLSSLLSKPEIAAAKPAEPFDIVLDAPATPAPPQAEKAPTIVITPRDSTRQRALPPVLEVTVAGDGRKSSPRSAEAEVAFARQLARHGDFKQALRFQHRAVEGEPLNMLFRLELAILYDRLGDKEAAATLYRQVVSAYDKDDSSLPRSLGIEDVRRRLAYLAKGSQ